jgi:dUTP pyrophosphatase
MNLKVSIKPLRDGVNLPVQATSGSAGYDIRANIDEAITLLCGERKLIPTGFAVFIHDPHYALKLFPRSGLGHKNGVVLGNLTGIVDSDYQGEIFVSLWNSGSEPFTIKPNDAIAQMIFERVEHPTFIIVDEFSMNTERGAGGFGSTTK